MRGDGLRLLAIGSWVALTGFVVLGMAVLPKTQAWVDSAAGLDSIEVGSKLARAGREAKASLSRRDPTGGSAPTGLNTLPRAFPKCWRRGLATAASMRRNHWSPTEPVCWRRHGVRPAISVPSRRAAYTRSHALGAEERARVAAHSDEVRGVALKLFEEIRGADYEKFLRGESSDGDTGSRAALASDNGRVRPRAGRTSRRTFSGCPIQSIWVGEARIEGESRPCVPYRLELSDGGVLAGDLAFEYIDSGRGGRWYPVTGIDWFVEGGAP